MYFYSCSLKTKEKNSILKDSIWPHDTPSQATRPGSSPGERTRESDRYAGKDAGRTQVGSPTVAPPESIQLRCLKMAVPLTSDLPGTPTEAGGDIQARSDSRGCLA